MIWWALFFLQQPTLVELPVSDTNPHTTVSDVAAGLKLFRARCAGCHGPAGDGGKGANLTVAVLPRAADDRRLYTVIRFGIPDTEMPGSLMTPREIWQVAAFVRTLGRVQRDAISGDPVRGRQLVSHKGGCLKCHAIGTEGGRMGPALTDVAVRRGPASLRGKLLNPRDEIPEQFRVVELTTKDGRSVSGVRLNEDTWSIQVRDFDDKLYSFDKQDLTALKVERRTLMPSYRDRFDAQELNDVVAYLAGLRGDQ